MLFGFLLKQPSHMATRTPFTAAHGDGIGPEIMAAALHIMEAAGALLDIETSLRNYDGKIGFTLAQGQ